jgi:micrococcal nuclease
MLRRNIALSVLAAVIALSAFALAPINLAQGEPSPPQAPHQSANWRVIDGDTFEDLGTGDRYRLENIDTPETGARARCTAERQLGDRATLQARALITGADTLDVRRTGRIDRYNRIIAFIEVDGRDLGELLIADGLARPWRGRREPWCDASGNLLP